MKSSRFLILTGLMLGLSAYAQATCTGGGDPCNAPRNPVIGTVSATQIPMTLQNSATPNVTGSIFFFQATTLGSAQNSPTADRNTVIVLTADFTNPATANDVIGQTLKPLLASSNYNLFGKVCPPGSSLPTDAGCSAWISAGSRTTNALTNAGFNSIAAADTAPRQFTARTNASVVDQTNVLAWLATNLNSSEVGNCSFTSSVQPFPLSGTTSMLIDQNDCSTLVPNRPYTLVEHLVYDPTQNAPNFTSGVFYTQAADPVADSVTNVTHCSAQLNYHNAVANPANPNDTTYSVAIGGPVSSGSATQTNVIGGTGIFSDADFVTFTNLQAGTNYNPTVTALNRGGAGWRASNADGFGTFQTLPWGNPTFTVTNVTTNSADFNISGLVTTGITSWRIRLNGNPLATTNGVPPTTIPLSGLTPNTQYAVQIELFEGGASCSSILPVPGTAFTTTPMVPSTFNLTATGPRALNATWGANGNPGTTVYQIQFCTDAAFTLNCVNAPNTAPGATSANISASVIPETTYFAHVRALTVGGGLNSAYSNSDSDTTPNEAPNITTMTCPNPVAPATSTTCTAQATDNGALNAMICHWSVNNGATLTSVNDQPTNAGGNCPSMGVSFPLNGPYTVSLTVTDHNGTVPPGLTDTDTRNVSVGTSGTSISISPSAATVVTGNTQVFTATVLDQFGNVIPGQAVNWSISSGGTVAPGNGASTTFTAVTAGGPYTLTATLAGSTPGTASITVTPTLILSDLLLSPPEITITLGQNVNFSVQGVDQFGNPIAVGSITWSANVSGNGNSALFSGSSLGARIRITATATNSLGQQVSKSAFVSVVNYDVTGAIGYPVPYKSTTANGAPICFKNLGTDSKIRIYTTSGRMVYSTQVLNADNTAPCPFGWNVKNNSGESVASGVYLYVIESPTTTKHGKLIIIQ